MESVIKNRISTICAVVAVLVAIMFVVSKFVHFGRVEWTDNAQVKREIVLLNSRVQGFIKEVRFDDFEKVKKGDTLVIIDDTDFRLVLAQAEAQYATALAGAKAAGVGVLTTNNNVSVGDAEVEEMRAVLDNAKKNLDRFAGLMQKGACTKKEYEDVKASYDALSAKYEGMTRTRKTKQLVADEQSLRHAQVKTSVRVAEASVDMARQNLKYTVITAPCDGVAGRKDICVGQLVQPGQPLLSVVSDEKVWVVANYRETQLGNIKDGSEAEIRVDAIKDVVVKGKVERASGASGSAFSVVPTDNATGNFVKVEQRVPVKISLEGNADEITENLKAGLNVEVEVKY